MSKKSLRIASWNLCNGLSNKLQYVKHVINEECIDILILQETEIKANYDLNLLDINGYHSEISNSSGTKRMVTYIRNSVEYKRIQEKIDSNVVLLELSNKYTVARLAGIYRQFKQVENRTQLQTFKLQLQHITHFIDGNNSFILIGDFNLDYNKRDVQNYAQRRIYDELLEMCIAFDLLQLIKEVTWSRIYQGAIRSSILDHVYTNNKEIITDIRTEKQPISDHSAVIISTAGVTKRKKFIYYEYECWKAYSKEALNDELRHLDLNQLSDCGVQQMADKLDQMLGTIKDKIVPIKKQKKKNYSEVPLHIVEMKIKLKNMFKRAKK